MKEFRGFTGPNGLAFIPVGGGAEEYICYCRLVLEGKEKARWLATKDLKYPIPAPEGVVVPAKLGSLIVEVGGSLPADPKSPNIWVHAHRVSGVVFKDGFSIVLTQEVPVEPWVLDLVPWDALNISGSRQWEPFVSTRWEVEADNREDLSKEAQ